MLATLVSLMRHHRRCNVIVTSMREVVGGRLAVDRRAILEGSKRRHREAAREAMDRHLRALARDLDRCWTRYVPAAKDGRTRTPR